MSERHRTLSHLPNGIYRRVARNCKGRWARFALVPACAAVAERLEQRRLLTTSPTYVDDNWNLVTDVGAPGASVGDTVRNDFDTIAPGTITATYGVDGFGTTIAGSDPAADSISDAITNTTVGGTVNVLEGVYSENVQVNKTVTLLGAQNGVDARTGRPGAAETILRGATTGATQTTSLTISASNVIVDGFTVQEASNPFVSGYGIYLVPGISGTIVLNNIVQNNLSGMSFSNNNSANPAIIFRNLFRNNNVPGPASGHGIYTDEFTAGFNAKGAIIDSNSFENNASAGIGLSSSTAGVQERITISNNSFSGNGNGIYAFYLTNSTFTFNDFATSVGSQVALLGGVVDVSITNNQIHNGGTNGIRMGDFIGANNGGLTIEFNTITANSSNGILVDNVPDAPYSIQCNTISGNVVSGLTNNDPTLLNAEENFWGNASGPTNPGNPGGTGDKVVGNVDFTPWAVDSNCTVHITPGTVTVQNDPCDPFPAQALVVVGTSLNDTIEVKLGSAHHPNNYQVKVTNSSGSTTTTGTVSPGDLARVIVYGLDGNDNIKVDTHGRTIPAWLFGGNGNDTETGNLGPDVLVGDAGNDQLTSDGGRDLLIGGVGADKLDGGKEDDILIGGNTDYDGNLNAICKIMDEWTSAASFSDRVNHLLGTLPGGMNTPFFLNSSTVHNDSVKDELKGGSGSDWFLADTVTAGKDKLADFKNGVDFLTQIT